MSVSIELLTDENILDYTRSNGRDRIVTDFRDLDLRKTTGIFPVAGGVYDVDIFGSPIEDQCICGKIRQPNPEPCPNCGARVFTREEGLRRFARIELPFYYLNDLRFEIFKELFDQIFQDSEIKLNFLDLDLKRRGYSGRSAKQLGIKVFDSCQFTYNAKKKQLTISEFITDMSKCSYEGLMEIIEKHFPDQFPAYMKLVNRYYLVQPSRMRPFTVSRRGSKQKADMGVHKLSSWYSVIIRLCCIEATESNDMNYSEVMERLGNPGERVRYTALLRAFLNAGKKEATELLNTSKENLARQLYSVRTSNSARCPIIPDTELAIDEISIPIHIAYELCRDGFLDYLMQELNFTRKDALITTKNEYNNPETLRLFKEYADKQIVLT